MANTKTTRPGKIAVIVVAAGRSRRFGGEMTKVYQPLGDIPLLRHTLGAFARHPAIGAIQPVIHPDDRAHYARATKGLALLDPVAGGAMRADSVLAGLRALNRGKPPLFVLIHDGARPFVSADTIDRVCVALQDGVKGAKGAIAASPVTDSLMKVDTAKTAASSRSPPSPIDRQGIWQTHTPQGFVFKDLLTAYETVSPEVLATCTDDAGLAHHAGIPLILVPDSPENTKITTAEDLDRGGRLRAGRAGGVPRVGIGFDAHRFCELADDPDRRPLRLAGVTVPNHPSLRGHSDADPGLHALADALLGAMGWADIGHHFPDTDPRWRDADSGLFIHEIMAWTRQAGGQIINADITIIAQRPKIAPYREAMRAAVGALLQVSPSAINIKATTTETMGFTGRGEGIAAQAVVTIMV
ncbi:MAG: 2-C-methyl-D-erythritol 2,4-cyclodiphosphate synthase [Pseudomonadota bacterium]